MQAPPPPVQRKKSPWPLIIWLGVGMLLILIAVCAFGGYKISQMVKEPPKPVANSGKPVLVSTSEDGWASYRFAEGPFQFELPTKPVFEPGEFDEVDSLFLTGYTLYEVNHDLGVFQMGVYYHRSKDWVDLAEDTDSIIESLKDEGLKPESPQDHDLTIGDIEGRELTVNYEVEGEKGRAHVFMWARKEAVYFIRSFTFGADPAKEDAVLRRIVTSFKEL